MRLFHTIPLTLMACAIGATAPPNAANDVKEFVYKKVGEREIKAHVHTPDGWKATDKRPVIVFFFGGGWTGGSVNAFLPQAEYFASRGLVTIRADYRIKSKDGVSPADCTEDARSAVRWVRANAAKLGIDPQKLITSGGSAGGHLAATTMMSKSVDTKGDDLSISTIPQAMLLFNPVFDMTHEKILTRLDGDKELARRISPIFALDKNAPPCVIFFGSDDALIAHGEMYWKKAKELGVRADRYVEEDKGHGFFNASPSRQKTIIVADKFLASLGYLEGKPTMTVPEGDELKKVRAADNARKQKQQKGKGRSKGAKR